VVIGLWNAWSVVNKAVGVRELIEEKELDALCVTETWLRSAGDDVEIGNMTPEGFSVFHRPRDSGKGGGVAVIARDTLKARVCKYRCFDTFENIELCVTRGKETVRLVCVYRPPPSAKNQLTVGGFLTDFQSFLSKETLPNENILLVGDLNVHMDNPNDSECRRLSKIVSSLGFQQMVTGPTHQGGHTLDVVLSRSDRLVTAIAVEDICMSDHFLVTIATDLSRPRALRTTMLCRNLKSIDRLQFRDDLIRSPLIENADIDSVESLVDTYNTVLTDILNRHAPEKEKVVPNRSQAPWINDSVRTARRARRRAERAKRKYGLVVHKQSYKKARQAVNKAIRQAKAEYFLSKVSDAASDSKKMFQIVDTLLHRKSRTQSLPDMDPQKAADAFSMFFQEKISRIRSGFSTGTQDQEADSAVIDVPFEEFEPLTADQIRKLIARSKPTTAATDPVPTRLLLEFIDTLLPVILRIVNLSLRSGTVPEQFKKAILKPLIKKQTLDPEVLGNYRPVSNLPFLSKVLERAVADQLLSHLKENALHAKFQSAYRSGHSTESALLRVVNDLLTMVDGGNSALLVLLDLTAAFDTIDHGLLIQRLHTEIGVSNVVLSWFSSYLTNRSQQVLVGSSCSPETPLLCGVPQGSVLGPLLFSLYTRQLAELVQSFSLGHHFFADDSELYSCLPPDHDAALIQIKNVESCCTEIKNWMDKNRLKLNEDKTEVLLCGPPNRRKDVPVKSLQVAGVPIEFCEVVRTLGIHLDADLCFEKQISSVVKTCYYHIRSLSKIRPCLTQKAANSIAVALVLSKLDYCNSLLSGVPQKQVQRLQLVQNAAARVVTKSRRVDRITPILSELHWLPVQYRIRHKLLSLTFQSVTSSTPQYLSELITKHEPSRSLRSASKSLLTVPGPKECRTKRYGQRSFRYTAPSHWNSIPQPIRESTSIFSFKKSLKTHFFKEFVCLA
jgi:hypothetical protein